MRNFSFFPKNLLYYTLKMICFSDKIAFGKLLFEPSVEAPQEFIFHNLASRHGAGKYILQVSTNMKEVYHVSLFQSKL